MCFMYLDRWVITFFTLTVSLWVLRYRSICFPQWCGTQVSKLAEPPLTEPHITSVVFPSKFVKSTLSRTFKPTAVVKVTIPGYYDHTVVLELKLKRLLNIDFSCRKFLFLRL